MPVPAEWKAALGHIDAYTPSGKPIKAESTKPIKAESKKTIKVESHKRMKTETIMKKPSMHKH